MATNAMSAFLTPAQQQSLKAQQDEDAMMSAWKPPTTTPTAGGTGALANQALQNGPGWAPITKPPIPLGAGGNPYSPPAGATPTYTGGPALSETPIYKTGGGDPNLTPAGGAPTPAGGTGWGANNGGGIARPNPNPEPYWNPASSDLFNNSNREAAGYAPIYTHDPNAAGANETSSAFDWKTDARAKNTTGMGGGTYRATMGETPEQIAKNTKIAQAIGYTGQMGAQQLQIWLAAHPEKQGAYKQVMESLNPPIDRPSGGPGPDAWGAGNSQAAGGFMGGRRWSGPANNLPGPNGERPTPAGGSGWSELNNQGGGATYGGNNGSLPNGLSGPSAQGDARPTNLPTTTSQSSGAQQQGTQGFLGGGQPSNIPASWGKSTLMGAPTSTDMAGWDDNTWLRNMQAVYDPYAKNMTSAKQQRADYNFLQGLTPEQRTQVQNAFMRAEDSYLPDSIRNKNLPNPLNQFQIARQMFGGGSATSNGNANNLPGPNGQLPGDAKPKTGPGSGAPIVTGGIGSGATDAYGNPIVTGGSGWTTGDGEIGNLGPKDSYKRTNPPPTKWTTGDGEIGNLGPRDSYKWTPPNTGSGWGLGEPEFTDYVSPNLPGITMAQSRQAPGKNPFVSEQFDFSADPGAKYRMEQANKALQARQLASGDFYSGGAMKEIAQLNSDLGSQEYANAFTRYLNNDANAFRNDQANYDADMGQWAANDASTYRNEQANNSNLMGQWSAADSSGYRNAQANQGNKFNQWKTIDDTMYNRDQTAQTTDYQHFIDSYLRDVNADNTNWDRMKYLDQSGQQAVNVGAGQGNSTAQLISQLLAQQGTNSANGTIGKSNANTQMFTNLLTYLLG